MKKLWKSNKPMVATLVSGALILLGILLNYQGMETLSAAVFVLSFIIGGFHQATEGIRDTWKNKRLNVDILMVLAAIGASLIGYWLEGALLIFIFSLSGSLEEYATNKSTEAITALMKVVPTTAKRYLSSNQLEEVSIEELQIGDRVLVPKGESVPTDGILLGSRALLDESAITGESIPKEKKATDELYASTINLQEAIQMEVTKRSKDTLFANIIRLVQTAQNTPSHTASLINRLENTYVKVVLVMVPLMIAVFYWGLDWTWNESFYRGMVLLTVASPCALVASATPATLSAISHAAKQGILFKGGIAIENFGRIDCMAFDKTGTLTEGKPRVTNFNRKPETDPSIIFAIVESLEHDSTHPIASALLAFLREQEYSSITLEDREDLTGFGLTGTYQNSQWKIGKEPFILTSPAQRNELVDEASRLQEDGKTVIYLSKDDEVVATFALLDTPKTDAKATIAFLKENNIHTIMITGDHEATAATIAKELGLDEYRANCLPEEKTHILKELQQTYQMVSMVGDGINDAPALAHSDVGIAMGGGTDIAMQTADVVLMKDELHYLAYTYELSNKLRRITLQNILFSLIVILFLIGANLFQYINLPLGVIGHEGSTILVILNGLRLLLGIKKKPLDT